MANHGKGLNWPVIKNDYMNSYLTGKTTLAALGKKYGCAYQNIQRRAKRECWTEEAHQPVRFYKDTPFVRERILELARDTNLSIRAIAQRCMLDDETVQSWLAVDEEFRKEFECAQAEILEDAGRAIKNLVRSGSGQDAWKVLENSPVTRKNFGGGKSKAESLSININIPRPGTIESPTIDITPEDVGDIGDGSSDQ